MKRKEIEKIMKIEIIEIIEKIEIMKKMSYTFFTRIAIQLLKPTWSFSAKSCSIHFVKFIGKQLCWRFFVNKNAVFSVHF